MFSSVLISFSFTQNIFIQFRKQIKKEHNVNVLKLQEPDRTSC